MMIDIHFHALPGVDDGPDTLEDALDLVKQAHDQGVRQIVATPHYRPPKYKPKNIESAFDALTKAIADVGLDIKLHLGREVFAGIDLLSQLDDIEFLTMGKSNYILLELPTFKIYPVHFTIIHQLLAMEYKIIIAHLEKFQYIIHDVKTLDSFLDLGLYMQMNAEYVISKPKNAIRLIMQGKIHLVASDAHNVQTRACKLKEAYDIVLKKTNKKIADRLFNENPMRMLADEPLLQVAVKEKRRSLLSFIASL